MSNMYSCETRTVINLLKEKIPPERRLVERTIISLMRLDAAIDRLEREKNSLIRNYAKCQRDYLDDFLHRLEARLANNTDISPAGYDSVIKDVIDTVKEMTEEQDESIS